MDLLYNVYKADFKDRGINDCMDSNNGSLMMYCDTA